jgi:3-dehydroquinate synthetase
MSKLIVGSEHDMERGIAEIIKLAKLKGKKTITLCFPSESLWDIFQEELKKEIIESKVTIPINVEAEVIIL